MQKRLADSRGGVGETGGLAAGRRADRLQAFGTLVILDAVTLRVLASTVAAPQALGISRNRFLTRPLHTLLPAAAKRTLVAFQNGAAAYQEAVFSIPQPGSTKRRRLPVCLHRRGARLFVELLHAPPQRLPTTLPCAAAAAQAVAEIHRQLAQAQTLTELCQRTTALVSQRLGFAHIAILHYEPSGAARTQFLAGDRAHGPQSASESAAPHEHAAAELLQIWDRGSRRNELLVVADAEAESVELSPSAAASGDELAGLLLQTVPDGCQQQLRKLCARAMLAVRLESQDGRSPTAEQPWGLLFCWDPRPQVPGPAERALLKVLAQLFSAQRQILSAQEDNRLTELRVRHAVEASGEPICILDMSGRTLLANAAFAALAGQPAHVLASRFGLESLLCESGIPERITQGLVAGGGYWQGETAFRSDNGESIPIELRVDMVHAADGQPVGYVGVCRDLRPHRRAEENLRLLESAVMNSCLAMIIARCPSAAPARGVLVNPSFTELTGIAAERALAAPLSCILGQEPEPEISQKLAAALAARRPYEAEFLFKREGGEPFWADLRAFPTTSADARDMDLVVTLRDVSSHRQAAAAKSEMERRLQESQWLDSLGILAAGIAHDFNNLLTGILGNASLLRAELRRSRHTDSYIDQIEETSLRAAELCKQLLAYAGKGQFTVRELSLSALAAETVPLFELALPTRQTVQLELASQLPEVRGDAAQLRQALESLLRNAAEALARKAQNSSLSTARSSRAGRSTGPILFNEALSSPAAELTVTTSLVTLDAAALRSTRGNPDAEPGEYVALEVRDTGSGITPEVQARMFDPFFTTKPDGRGLGLSTVIGIVRRHGGVLKVQSAVNRGSTFSLLLPAYHPAKLDAAELLPAAAPETQPRGNLVLVVDDEEQVRTILRHLLTAAGYTVELFSDGGKAVERVQRSASEVGLVLLDLTMQRMSGEATLARLLRLRSDLPIVMMSGYREADLQPHLRALGVSAFLGKPFSPSQVLATVRQALRAH